MEGWIKLHRSILDNWTFQDDKYFRWWVTILLLVNHKEQKFIVDGSPEVCSPGESFRSIEDWAYHLRSSKKTVLRFFKLLEDNGVIKCVVLGKGNRRKHLLTVRNWGIYQSTSTEIDTINTPKIEPERNQNSPPNKKEKNQENEKNISPIVPSDMSAEFESYVKWCKANAPNLLKMKSPMTNDELNKLMMLFKKTAIKITLQNMDNRPNLLAKYRSTYLTCLNWLRLAIDRGEKVLLDDGDKNKPENSVIKSDLSYPESYDNTIPVTRFNETARQKYHKAADWAKLLNNTITEEEYKAKYPYDKTHY